MPVIKAKNNTQKMLPTLVAMSPYEVYLNQVKGTLDTIRFTRQGMSYLPPQFGGLSGQRKIIAKNLVVQTIDFEVKE